MTLAKGISEEQALNIIQGLPRKGWNCLVFSVPLARVHSVLASLESSDMWEPIQESSWCVMVCLQTRTDLGVHIGYDPNSAAASDFIIKYISWAESVKLSLLLATLSKHRDADVVQHITSSGVFTPGAKLVLRDDSSGAKKTWWKFWQ
jgi:hypothetical protein